MTGPGACCRDPGRLERLRAHNLTATAPLNAIVSLEVFDAEALAPGMPAAAEALRQKILFVECLRPVTGLTASNVQIDGGVRVRDVRAVWATDGTLAGAPAEAGDLGASADGHLPKANHLVVRVDRRGDFSDYTLRIVAGGGLTTPHKDFDARLAAIDFGFKVECSTGLDCPHDPACPDEPDKPVALDYTARDYASLRRVMLDRLAMVAPQRTDQNPADLAVTLVEALAAAADHLHQQIDAAGTEAYLDVARLRTSVRRHTRLLDYALHEGCNARAWVAFEVEADGVEVPGPGAAAPGSLLLTRCAPQTVLKEDAAKSLEAEPQWFETMQPGLFYRAHNLIRFHTWGDAGCVLPAGATAATLRDDGPHPLRLRAGDVLVLEQVGDADDPPSAAAYAPQDATTVEGGDPLRRHAVRLVKVSPEATVEGGLRGAPLRGDDDPRRDRVLGRPVVEVEWAQEDALPFSLCLSAEDGEGHVLEDLAVARGNVVLADHGRTSGPEGLPPPASEAEPCLVAPYRPALEPGPLAHGMPLPPDLPGRPAPAARLLVQDPRRCVAQATLDDGRRPWQARSDLLASRGYDPHFVVEEEPGRPPRLRFGDGVHGQRPDGLSFQVRRRTGTARAGNVGAGAIRHVVEPADRKDAFAGIRAVRNPLPAAGGTPPERLKRARLEAPFAFRKQERAVTVQDFEQAAQGHPEVQRAVGRRAWTGSWHTTFVTIDRTGGRPVDAAFRQALAAHLSRLAMVGHDVEIEGPTHVSLDIVMRVCIAPDRFKGVVKAALQEVFSSRAAKGFFHPDRWTFGTNLHASQIVERAMSVPGVLSVDVRDETDAGLRFRRRGQAPAEGDPAETLVAGRTEILRADSDPNLPENGGIDFLIHGGL